MKEFRKIADAENGGCIIQTADEREDLTWVGGAMLYSPTQLRKFYNLIGKRLKQLEKAGVTTRKK